MATLAGAYNSSDSYYPKLAYTISASQTGRNATSVTYTFNCTVSLRSTGGYGYDIILNYNIGGVTGSRTLKTTSGGFSSSTGNFSVTVSTNAAGGTNAISAQMWSSSSNDSSHWQNAFNTGTKYLDKSTFNTAPSSTGISISNSGTQWETTSSSTVTVTCSDADRNLSEIVVERLVNGATNAEFRYSSGWSLSGNTYTLSFTDTGIGGFGEGTRISYRATCKDTYGEWSGWGPTSATLTKNTLNPASLGVSNSTISWGTSNVGFSYSGASNSNGNGTFSYFYSNDAGIPIYNNGEVSSFTANQIDIEGWGGTATGRPYIKYSDLIAFVQKNSSRTGTFTLRLHTRNAAGTTKTSQVSITVSLKPNPTGGETTSLSGAVAMAGSSYYVPNVGGTYTLNWGAGVDATGGSGITYNVQASYGGGAWYDVSVNLSGTSLDISSDVKRYNVTAATTYKVRVVTKTEYGTNKTSSERAITLHYWNEPSVSIINLVRKNTEWTASVSAKVNSSIATLSTLTWSGNGVTNSTTGLTIAANKLTGSGSMGQTGITAQTTFSLSVKVVDNSGQTRGTSTDTIVVSKYQPIISMREYGLGVNAFADSTYKFNVGGNANVAGRIDAGDRITVIKNNIYNSELYSNGNVEMRTTNGSFPSIGFHRAGSSATALLHKGYGADSLWIRNADGAEGRVYSELFKPTPDSIGAIAHDGVNTGWFRSSGNQGWYSQTHGGGWYMTDSSWIRAYNGKGITTTGNLSIGSNIDTKGIAVGNSNPNDQVSGSPWYGLGKTDFNFSGASGSAVQLAGYWGVRLRNGNVWLDLDWAQPMVKIGNSYGFASFGSLNSGYFHIDTDRPAFHFTKDVSIAGNTMLYNSGTNFIAQPNYGIVARTNSGATRYLTWGDGGGDVILGYNNQSYILSYGHLAPVVSRAYWLGTNSPDRQWKGVCCEGGVVGASDGRVKENMVRLDGTIVEIEEESNSINEIVENRARNIFDRAIPEDYYEFMKDRFKPTYYNYKMTRGVEDTEPLYDRTEEEGYEDAPQISLEDELKMLSNVGFIAQDYDLENDKVAQEFIIENSDGSLNYNHMSYATVGMVALQEAIKKIETLEKRIAQLEGK